VNAKELIKIVSDKTKFHIDDVSIVFNTIITEIKNINQNNRKITIAGFGIFKIINVKSSNRTKIKNDSKTTYQVKSYKYIKFIPATKYKKQIKTKPEAMIVKTS